MSKQIFKTGQFIKAYDFRPMPDRGECYVEGEIMSVNYPNDADGHYVIVCTKDVFDGVEQIGENSRRSCPVIVPIRLVIGDYDARVTEVK
jgi:hypothetical protein